jgi:multiple sugar transport system ATP-binding protein
MVRKTLILGIRAENITVEAGDKPAPTGAGGRLPAKVIVSEPLGAQQLLTVQVGDDILKVATSPDLVVQPGQDVGLELSPGKLRLFDEETDRAMLL